jgi:hypothetical protein
VLPAVLVKVCSIDWLPWRFFIYSVCVVSWQVMAWVLGEYSYLSTTMQQVFHLLFLPHNAVIPRNLGRNYREVMRINRKATFGWWSPWILLISHRKDGCSNRSEDFARISLLLCLMYELMCCRRLVHVGSGRTNEEVFILSPRVLATTLQRMLAYDTKPLGHASRAACWCKLWRYWGTNLEFIVPVFCFEIVTARWM